MPTTAPAAGLPVVFQRQMISEAETAKATEICSKYQGHCRVPVMAET